MTQGAVEDARSTGRLASFHIDQVFLRQSLSRNRIISVLFCPPSSTQTKTRQLDRITTDMTASSRHDIAKASSNGVILTDVLLDQVLFVNVPRLGRYDRYGRWRSRDYKSSRRGREVE